MIKNVTSGNPEVTFYFCVSLSRACIGCSRSDANEMCMERAAGSTATMDAE